MMTRSISAVGKSSSSSSSIAHNHHLKPISERPAMAKTQKNITRKQPGTTLSSKPVKKKPAEIILTTNHHHQEPSVPVTESADHHHETEVSANRPDPNQTEINNNSNNSSSKTVQEKENIVVVGSDHEELEDLKSIEDSSLLSIPEEPPIDPVDTITEEADAEISAPENLQESCQNADTIPLTPEDPKVEDKDCGESNNTITSSADPKSPDEVSGEEKGDETMHPSCHSHSHSSSSDNNCSENMAENQEEEEEEREKEKDKKPDNHHYHHHHQELADEEVKEITDDHNNNNNNNVVQSPEAKPVLKRNESVVSNDVIEETASKLREQRKNKVKALAGAFETVISLQDK